MEEFLDKYPRFTDFILGFVKNEEIFANMEINKLNEQVVLNKAKAVLANIEKHENLNKSSSAGSKYKVEKLEDNEGDYQFLEKSLKPSSDGCINYYETDLINNSKSVHFYRVSPTGDTSKDSSECTQVLLLHRTKATEVESILKSGFKPSQEGPRGPGVYLTDSINYAYQFGRCFARDDDKLKCFRYYFVCKTKQSQVKVPKKSKKEIPYQEYLTSKPSVQVFEEFASEPIEFENSPSDKLDSNDNRILQGTFQKDPSKWKKALAHHELVVPVYLVEVEDYVSAREIVNYVLYDKLELQQYSFENYITRNNFDNVEECTIELIIKEMKIALAAYQQAKLKHLSTVIRKKFKSVMHQLTFDMSSILEGNLNAKYRTELLQKENDDHKFILSTIAENDVKNKVLQVFKINPASKSESGKFTKKFLLLHGVKSDRLHNVLAYGYPRFFYYCLLSYKYLTRSY